MSDEQIQDSEAPYVGPSCEQVAATLREALSLLRRDREEASQILTPTFVQALEALFQEELEAVTDHVSGPGGTPIPVLDVAPCHSEIRAADLAQALLDLEKEDEPTMLQVTEDGGAAIVEVHIHGEHRSLSQEFDTLSELATGLEDMAATIRGLDQE